MKLLTSLLILLCVTPEFVASAEVLTITSPSAILMEASTGQIIYETNADEQLAPASVTKVMTLLLIFESLESGKIQLEDEVVVSEYAASMGGSQVFLEVGEVQTVDTMIKCIAVSSANDACVAMAEYISGTNDAFVESMNAKADELGMTNTNFVNCNGLDAEGHLTTARDIALMSRELVTKYPEVYDYTTIWMDTITHVTANGSSEFGLSSTNKLLTQYEYATGLKTGSTDEAKFCLSATATKEDIDLISVVMAAPDSATRIEDSITLLDYGFSLCQLYTDEESMEFTDIDVEKGVEDVVTGKVEEVFTYMDIDGLNLEDVSKEVIYEANLVAPIEEGDIVGTVVYHINGVELGFEYIYATESVEELNFKNAMEKLLPFYLL